MPVTGDCGNWYPLSTASPWIAGDISMRDGVLGFCRNS